MVLQAVQVQAGRRNGNKPLEDFQKEEKKMNYATMCSEPTHDVEPARFEPIPAVLDKANTSLGDALLIMLRVYRLMFGEEPTLREAPKLENLTQSAEWLSVRADNIRQSVQALAERLGA